MRTCPVYLQSRAWGKGLLRGALGPYPSKGCSQVKDGKNLLRCKQVVVFFYVCSVWEGSVAMCGSSRVHFAKLVTAGQCCSAEYQQEELCVYGWDSLPCTSLNLLELGWGLQCSLCGQLIYAL